jgi:hypothetical protein
MASINVIKVDVLDNPSMFQSDFKFEITFECIAPIKDGASRQLECAQLLSGAAAHAAAPLPAGGVWEAALAPLCMLRWLCALASRACPPPHIRPPELPPCTMGACARALTPSPAAPCPPLPPGADLEWKVVYVGSAKGEEHDQVLDEVLVGPVPLGTSKFVLQVRGPQLGGRARGCAGQQLPARRRPGSYPHHHPVLTVHLPPSRADAATGPVPHP